MPQQGSYVQRMRGNVDRAMEYALGAYKAFMKHSELKKPYQATNYDDMEYETPEWPQEPPGPGPSPIPGPGPEPPPPGPPPTPGPSPGPSPTPDPPPWWNDVWFCDVPTLFFCPGGSPVLVLVNTNDRVTTIEVDGNGSSSGRSYIPGDGAGSGTIHVTTAHGATCSGLALAKDPSQCQEQCGTPTIGYTTTQMDINETQQLSIVGGLSGATYTWNILAGGGSITGTGLYTAPSSNPGCNSNPTIALMCNGLVMDTLTIAINAINEIAGYGAYCAKSSINPPNGTCYAQILARNLLCDGSYGVSTSGCSDTQSGSMQDGGCDAVWEGLCTDAAAACSPAPAKCAEDGCSPYGAEFAAPYAHDTRTADQISRGCCPPQFI